MINTELSEQEHIRRASLQKLRDNGINPYPADEFKVNVTANQIINTYNPLIPNLQEVAFAGRLMSRRIMGKASFGELQDNTGRIQIYISRDEICPDED
jgi:lysyl-tRNA synthetase, class II